MAAARRRLLWLMAALIASIILVAIVLAGWLAWRWATTSPCRSALPRSATDIHEKEFDYFPDFEYLLVANMPESEFEPYCQRLGLTPHYAGRVYTDDIRWLSWDAPWGDRPRRVEWWDPKDTLEGTWVKQSGHWWRMAKYERGTLYVREHTH